MTIWTTSRKVTEKALNVDFCAVCINELAIGEVLSELTVTPLSTRKSSFLASQNAPVNVSHSQEDTAAACVSYINIAPN